MCFEDNRRRNRVELICECREVRSNFDNNRNRFDRRREDERRCCRCRECNRRNSNWRW